MLLYIFCSRGISALPTAGVDGNYTSTILIIYLPFFHSYCFRELFVVLKIERKQQHEIPITRKNIFIITFFASFTETL